MMSWARFEQRLPAIATSDDDRPHYATSKGRESQDGQGPYVRVAAEIIGNATCGNRVDHAIQEECSGTDKCARQKHGTRSVHVPGDANHGCDEQGHDGHDDQDW